MGTFRLGQHRGCPAVRGAFQVKQEKQAYDAAITENADGTTALASRWSAQVSICGGCNVTALSRVALQGTAKPGHVAPKKLNPSFSSETNAPIFFTTWYSSKTIREPRVCSAQIRGETLGASQSSSYQYWG